MNSIVILYFFITINSYIKLEMAQVYPACTTIEVITLNLKFVSLHIENLLQVFTCGEQFIRKERQCINVIMMEVLVC